jgi:hypothetical protein
VAEPWLPQLLQARCDDAASAGRRAVIPWLNSLNLTFPEFPEFSEPHLQAKADLRLASHWPSLFPCTAVIPWLNSLSSLNSLNLTFRQKRICGWLAIGPPYFLVL